MQPNTLQFPVQLQFNSGSQVFPIENSDDELSIFKKLQESFCEQYEIFFPDNLAAKTIVVIPSLTLDQEVLGKVTGALHYEERLLCLLMLLRMPRTKVIYVTSVPIDPVIIDYYLHLLPGITGYHARERLTLLSCYDASHTSLTEKILKRPRLIERIKQQISEGNASHIACFNTTNFERTLAVRLGIPIFGCDPLVMHWGSKSGSRKLFREAGVAMPSGSEDLNSYIDIVDALVELKIKHSDIKKAVIKLNDGFSGDGNAMLTYPTAVDKKELHKWIDDNLKNEIKPVATEMSVDSFLSKFSSMGGIVEAFIEGRLKTSPSVQCRIEPTGNVEIVSTHDQVLTGDCGQIFSGAHFPANEAYRLQVAELSKKIAIALKNKGALGRFAIDFISVFEKDEWHHYPIEINLRKGGTTHPFLMLQFLTNGYFDETNGLFTTQGNQHRYYYASDNVQSEAYKGLTPHDLIDIAMFHGLHFDGATQKGVMFHMIGALSQYGKMGVVCIGESPEEAWSFYEKTLEVMDAETMQQKIEKAE